MSKPAATEPTAGGAVTASMTKKPVTSLLPFAVPAKVAAVLLLLSPVLAMADQSDDDRTLKSPSEFGSIAIG